MVDIRQKGKDFIAWMTPQLPIQSMLSKSQPDETNPLFYTYTMHHTQKELFDFWTKYKPPESKRVLTTCNEFVNYYCDWIGFRAKVGGFDIPEVMRLAHLNVGWVTSRAGIWPKPGDILRHKSTHMDICASCDGTLLTRLASGQHGPDRDPATHLPRKGTSYDEIKEVPGGYDWTALSGWFDLELAWPGEMPVPEWLVGWWQCVFDDSGDTYYYHFARDRVVAWTQVRPIGKWNPGIPKDGGLGVFNNDDESTVSIKWNSGSTEMYWWNSTDEMVGAYKVDTLTATKMFT